MKIHGTHRILSNHQSSARKQILPAENIFLVVNSFLEMLCTSVAGSLIVCHKVDFHCEVFILENLLIQTLANAAKKCVQFNSYLYWLQ